MQAHGRRDLSDIIDQETLPLYLLAAEGAAAFQAYLHYHHLHPLDVALVSGVRYLTVWNISHGILVSSTHAALVRSGLLKLTGIPFMAPLAIQQDTS